MLNAVNRFAENPVNMNIPRSGWKMQSTVKTSFNTGQLIPFYCTEILPSDSCKVKTSIVCRMQTLITPPMDNLFLDTYYFFIPNRLLWEHWEEFLGENKTGHWIQDVVYEVPMLKAPSGGWDVGSLADYFGIPTGIENIEISALPFRAYGLICNEWFRSENLTDPVLVNIDDTVRNGTNGTNEVTDVQLGGVPFKVAKLFDYFTSALPAPQKGDPVVIPILGTDPIPVQTSNIAQNPSDFVDMISGKPVPLAFTTTGSVKNPLHFSFQVNPIGTNSSPNAGNVGDNNATGWTGGDMSRFSAGITENTSYPINLYAYPPEGAGVIDINTLRTAFQMQRFFERMARGGSRYRELIKSFFGVSVQDMRVQIPEFLGANRIPININQIIQQSETATTPQGTTTGMSLTTDVNYNFDKSFTEHGYIIGLMCVRYEHSYQQGLHRMWSRKGKFDFYWPTFAHLGEGPIYNREIFAQGTEEDNEVFGYQERWAEYRYSPSYVTGEMRSNHSNTLDVWHLADDYETLPMLSDEWIREDKSNVDRVLAVTSEVSNQFFADILVENEIRRAMPLYSVPGLIDHF